MIHNLEQFLFVYSGLYTQIVANFVWFYGPTAVGKDTLIHKLTENPQHPLVAVLGLELPFFIDEDAMRLRHGEREDLVDKLVIARELGKTILIKAQGYDMGRLMPIDLKQRLPDDRHLVVYLDADPEIIREHRIRRGQQPPTWNDFNDRQENLRLALDVEKAGMDFIWLDNNGSDPVVTTRPMY